MKNLLKINFLVVNMKIILQEFIHKIKIIDINNGQQLKIMKIYQI